jgi:hypothetical protein
MKHCHKCNCDKDESEFWLNKCRKDGLQTRCKSCKREWSKNHYKENKNGYKDRAVKRNKIVREETKNLINDIKYNTGCKYCPENEPVCLDFHHLDSSKKEYNIAVMKLHKKERVLAEVGKCIVVCSNCHRKLHAGII